MMLQPLLTDESGYQSPSYPASACSHLNHHARLLQPPRRPPAHLIVGALFYL